MVKCQRIIQALEQMAPTRLAESWDNPGLLVGSPEQKIQKIMVCLDVTERVIDQAAAEHIDLLVAHHPLLFKPLKQVRTDLPLGRMLQKLLIHRIAVYAAHTNLDIAPGGVNDVLAGTLGLQDIKPFVRTADMRIEPADNTLTSLGRIGYLDTPLTPEAFVAHVQQSLHAEGIRWIPGTAGRIRKVALCSGSGAEFIGKAAFLGADAYVTGDVRYHDAQHAAEMGIHLIDAGHFATEYPIVPVLAERLKAVMVEKGDLVEIEVDTAAKDFFSSGLQNSGSI